LGLGATVGKRRSCPTREPFLAAIPGPTVGRPARRPRIDPQTGGVRRYWGGGRHFLHDPCDLGRIRGCWSTIPR